MEEKKQAEKPVVKKLSEMTPEEQEAIRKSFREKLRKYYENRPSREHIQNSLKENQDEYNSSNNVEGDTTT